MALADLPPSGTDPATGAAVVRVLSYNIRSMRDDPAALARVVRACAPDVVCVQEAPRFPRWRRRAALLARLTGLTYVAGGATTCGPLLLASMRARVVRTREVLLPRTPGLHRRGLAMAVLRFGAASPGAELAVASCHLSLAAAEREAQTGLLLEHLGALGTPHAVLAGDINEGPGGRSFRQLAAQLQDGWAVRPWGSELTLPPAAPRTRIDAVFASRGVEVLGCGVPLGLPGVTQADLMAATDHLPVLAAVRVPAG
ncbi:endonuclease/exonuclease/phosphatase family protein [Streptomyces polyrhachis]|uniref:Endonuclease/exonuclease/phosphatase family protein n=1 Tax=Streptomyces polyrhachis TaxID=1282885 RepID=A0ABW2G7I6_9ACTN